MHDERPIVNTARRQWVHECSGSAGRLVFTAVGFHPRDTDARASEDDAREDDACATLASIYRYTTIRVVARERERDDDDAGLKTTDRGVPEHGVRGDFEELFARRAARARARELIAIVNTHIHVRVF